MALAEKSQQWTLSVGILSSNGQTMLPTPQPTSSSTGEVDEVLDEE